MRNAVLPIWSIIKEAPYTFTPDGSFPVINLEKARLAKEFCAQAPLTEDLPRICAIHAGDKVNVVPAKAEALIEGIDEEILERMADRAAEKTNALFVWEQNGDRTVIRVKGTAAHASTPEAGNNALTALLLLLSMLPVADSQGFRAICALQEMFPHGDTAGQALHVNMEDEESGALTMNLGILNYQDGKLSGSFDSRAPLCANNENLTEVLRQRFSAAGFTMEAGGMTPAHYVSPDSEFVRTLLESYERYTGIKGKPLAIGGGTYVHELERGVAFGCDMPGVDNHMHGDDEFMEIQTMVMSAKIFADVIVKLCC